MSQSENERQAGSLPAQMQRKSGRAVFDEGRTVWEWQTATGVFERYVSDEQLSRLEASDLRLLEPSSPEKDNGNAIYGSRTLAPTQPRKNIGAFRQLWRRLLPAT